MQLLVFNRNITNIIERRLQDEIDFIISKGKRLVAIEVKSGKSSTAVVSGVEYFTKNFRPFRTVVVGSSGIELEKFLKTPILDWFS